MLEFEIVVLDFKVVEKISVSWLSCSERHDEMPAHKISTTHAIASALSAYCLRANDEIGRFSEQMTIAKTLFIHKYIIGTLANSIVKLQNNSKKQ